MLRQESRSRSNSCFVLATMCALLGAVTAVSYQRWQASMMERVSPNVDSAEARVSRQVIEALLSARGELDEGSLSAAVAFIGRCDSALTPIENAGIDAGLARRDAEPLRRSPQALDRTSPFTVER